MSVCVEFGFSVNIYFYSSNFRENSEGDTFRFYENVTPLTLKRSTAEITD